MSANQTRSTAEAGKPLSAVRRQPGAEAAPLTGGVTVVAEARAAGIEGVPQDRIAGTAQNDTLKEYVSVKLSPDEARLLWQREHDSGAWAGFAFAAPSFGRGEFADDEAIALANDTHFGLAAGIWTRDVGRAHRVAGRLEVGIGAGSICETTDSRCSTTAGWAKPENRSSTVTPAGPRRSAFCSSITRAR